MQSNLMLEQIKQCGFAECSNICKNNFGNMRPIHGGRSEMHPGQPHMTTCLFCKEPVDNAEMRVALRQSAYTNGPVVIRACQTCLTGMGYYECGGVYWDAKQECVFRCDKWIPTGDMSKIKRCNK